MIPQPKNKTPRNAKYLAWIRKKPCVICGRTPAGESHHENENGHAAMGLKTSDYRTLPMCAIPCHHDRHQKGRSVFGDIDVEAIIKQLNEEWEAQCTK